MQPSERFFLASVVVVTFFASALLTWCQPTTLSADLARATLTWTWAQGTGAPVEKWLIRCGPRSGVYSMQVEITDPAARSVPILQVVPNVGTYFCVIVASNRAGNSAPSREFMFTSGKLLPAPTLQVLEIQ